MFTASGVIITLKILVAAVTLILLTSLIALAKGKVQLHGRINLVFFILTYLTLIAFEGVIRFLQPELMNYFESDPVIAKPLSIHLWFAVPSALLMPVMLYTGMQHHRRVHLTLAAFFSLLWTGTVFTGIFYLPHAI